MKIVELHRQGLSVSAIARRTGADRKTVRKYIANGVAVPRYGPRTPRPGVIDPYLAYVTERVQRYPELSERRLLREIRELGYTGGRTALGDVLRAVRPPRRKPFEIRFETAAGVQAQVDFAHFKVVFDDAPSQPRALWLFSLVLGHSRYLWARFVAHQDLQTVLRMHGNADFAPQRAADLRGPVGRSDGRALEQPDALEQRPARQLDPPRDRGAAARRDPQRRATAGRHRSRLLVADLVLRALRPGELAGVPGGLRPALAHAPGPRLRGLRARRQPASAGAGAAPPASASAAPTSTG
jgi:hypothetical protein